MNYEDCFPGWAFVDRLRRRRRIVVDVD